MTSSSAAKNTGRYLSLRAKLLLAFSVLFTVVGVATYYWFLQYSTQTALRKIKEDQLLTIQGAAGQIDAEELLALYREGQPNTDGFSDDPRYQANLDTLERIHRIEPRAWLGTYVLEGDNLVFVTDLWARYNTEKAATFKTVCEPVSCADGDPTTATAISLAQDAVRQGEIKMLGPIVEDQWGEWSSAWAPIRDGNGQVVAGLFLDFEAAYVKQVQMQVETQIAVAAIFSYIIVFVMVFLVSNQLTRPVITLTRAAARIGEGDYKQDLAHLSQVNFHDEISTMADVFTIMVGKVYQREQSLIKQVEELRIEIDDTKRKKQVSEIVDSEFFQDLQAKSRAMRLRRSAEEAPDPSETSSTT
jgi:hypothetical protein